MKTDIDVKSLRCFTKRRAKTPGGVYETHAKSTTSHNLLLTGWLDLFNAELSPERYWRGPTSKKVGGGGGGGGGKGGRHWRQHQTQNRHRENESALRRAAT